MQLRTVEVAQKLNSSISVEMWKIYYDDSWLLEVLT